MKNQLTNEMLAIRSVPAPRSMSELGGFLAFKQWVCDRKHAFTENGAKYGLRPPRGMLLVGIQGTGKSLAATVVAHEWELPLYMLDMGSVFSSYVGESEERLRKVFEFAEYHAPCVVWLDEIERGLAVGIERDTGITSRLIGGMLTWLQERRKPVFVAATANQITWLPPELLRPGRFDVIWGVDVPGVQARKEILSIQLQAHKRDPGDFNLDFLAEMAYGLTGSEIELGIDNALYQAFAERRNVNGVDVARALEQVVPICHKFEAEVTALRKWMALNAVSVEV